MLSPQQQRGRLRSRVVSAVKSYNIARELRSMLRGNDQNVTGSLAGQISYQGREIDVSVSSTIDSSSGYIDNIEVDVEIPWGRYGKKLDQVGGDNSNAEGQMYPNIEDLEQWIRAKGIQTSIEVTSTLKSGNTKTYKYENTSSSIKNMAWHVRNKIVENNELATRYDYSDEIRDDLQVVIDNAVSDWFGELTEDFMGDVFVEIGNIIG